MSVESPTPQQLTVEGSIFWSVGLLILAGRLYARLSVKRSIRNLYTEDYIALVTHSLYTALIVLIVVSSKFATNLFPPEELEDILKDPAEVESRIYGSKIVIALEICMICVLWGTKTCLCFAYYRLSFNLKEQPFVKAIAVYVAIGFVTIEVCYFAVWCRPFPQYWAVPPNSEQCATYTHYNIMQACFNISADLMLFAIPIPIVLRGQMPLQRKLALLATFSLGVFVIIAAVLSKYYNFSYSNTTIYQVWYIREASTAVYVSHLACWWPTVRAISSVFTRRPSMMFYQSRSRNTGIATSEEAINMDIPGKTSDGKVHQLHEWRSLHDEPPAEELHVAPYKLEDHARGRMGQC
ncbi:MAG: hypothetical protein M1831_001011 [Alyxoria varia]|nr:MAG: hypothetical protein M1831_001011 [Alyxoria varia]